MMYFLPDNVKTEALLKSGQQLIKDPSKWCKAAMQRGDSFCINGALFAVGTPNPRMPDEFVSEDVLYFRGDLPRGFIPEPFWFLRKALRAEKLISHCLDQEIALFENVGVFNDHELTSHFQVMELFEEALRLLSLENSTNSRELELAY